MRPAVRAAEMQYAPATIVLHPVTEAGPEHPALARRVLFGTAIDSTLPRRRVDPAFGPQADYQAPRAPRGIGASREGAASPARERQTRQVPRVRERDAGG